MKIKHSLMMIMVFFLLCLAVPGMAADNTLEIDVNASGDDYGANVIYTEGSDGLVELELDWKEKVYYDAETYEYFHPAISIENTGKTDGYLIVKIDILHYGTYLSAETYYFSFTGSQFKTPVMQASSRFDVNNPKETDPDASLRGTENHDYGLCGSSDIRDQRSRHHHSHAVRKHGLPRNPAHQLGRCGNVGH